MQIKITHQNIELTDAIKDYVEEKIGSIVEMDDSLQIADVVVGKESNHHGKGDVFHCRVNVSYPGGMFRADEFSDDLYKSIDFSKDTLKREVAKNNEKNS